MKKLILILILSLFYLPVHAQTIGGGNEPVAVNLNNALSSSIDTITAYQQKTSTATTSQVSCGTTSATLKAANTTRISIDYQNFTPTTSVYVCENATCTTAGAGKLLGDTSKLYGYTESNYTGALSCITASGTATVGVTEK